MASNLKKKILTASSLNEVFDVIIQESKSSGTLKITCGDVHGTVAFAQGRLIGAHITNSGELGTEALDKLLQLHKPKVSYAALDKKSIGALSDAERVDIDLRQLMQSLKLRQAEKSCDSSPMTERQKLEDAIAAVPATVSEKGEPAGSEPDEIARIAADPIDTEVQAVQSVQAEETTNAAVQNDTATTEPVRAEAATTESVQGESTSVEPVHAEASAMQSGQPEDTKIEPVQSELTEVEPHTQAETSEPLESITQPMAAQAGNLLDAVFGVPEFASEDGLSPEKRKLLHQTAENMQDEELFNQSDPLLESLDAASDFSAAKSDLLAVTPLDQKPFDEAEKTLKYDDIPSLTDEQRKLLTLVEAEARDLETFEQLDDFLQDKGIDVTSQQLADLRQAMALRSSDEQRQEFHRSDESLKSKDTAEFRDFVEPVVPESSSVEDLNAIPAPKVIDADMTPLVLLAEQDLPAAKKGKTGLLGDVDPHVKFRLGVSTGERLRARKEYPIGKIMGIVTISMLCIGIFTLPAAIKSSATNLSAEGLQESVLNLAITDEMKEDVPAVQLEDSAQAALPVGHVAVGSGSNDNESVVAAVQNDPLAYAGMLVSEGKTASAIPWYQDYIKHNPSAVAARVQLIRCLISLKQPAKARLVCIETLKLKLSDAELNSVWDLMRSCLTD